MNNSSKTVLQIPPKLVRCSLIFAGLSLSLLAMPAWSQSNDQDNEAAADESGLKLPDDLSAPESAVTGSEKFVIEEHRVGTRLDRVTVYRDNGIQEVYENREVNSLLGAEETELGEVPNMRRWTIGSW